MTGIYVQIDPNGLGSMIMQVVIQRLDNVDDAGCDWFTHGECTYIGSAGCMISYDKNIATLVNAANILKYGEPKHLTEEMIKAVVAHEYAMGY